ncbi:MAG: tRNA 2-thiouridine(34) synthase MnmA [Chloroflexota bacterium]
MSLNVLVAMSGGLDSSVAAALLKEQGYSVAGAIMTTWAGGASQAQGRRHGCYGPGEDEDVEDARRVAATLGIPFHVFDLSREYKAEVLDHFCRGYLSGETPNPCVRCNRRIKFDALPRKARSAGIAFDCFATGHYARAGRDGAAGRYLLKKGKDSNKDQSYFLSFLSQEQLARTLFPVGDYTREEVRKMAADFGLDVGSKPKSQDFMSGGYSSLIQTAAPGPILDETGNVLGRHWGIPFYTIGQRKGLGISSKEPLHVIGIDLERNAIIVGRKERLYGDELVASALNWIAVEKLDQPAVVKALIRYRHPEAGAVLTPLDGDKVHVRFREPQMSITPGQAVVFYDGDTVLGAGVIQKVG